jgi:hypothetical protein
MSQPSYFTEDHRWWRAVIMTIYSYTTNPYLDGITDGFKPVRISELCSPLYGTCQSWSAVIMTICLSINLCMGGITDKFQPVFVISSYIDIQLYGYTVIRLFGYIGIRLNEYPVTRIFGNADIRVYRYLVIQNTVIQIFCSMDPRLYGYLGVRISKYLEFI